MPWQDYYNTRIIDDWFPDQKRENTRDNDYLYQTINCLNLKKEALPQTAGFGLLGFCCDEGVKRNLGRVGAKEGPAAIRRCLSTLANPTQHPLYDVGDVVCRAEDLESAQASLSETVNVMLAAGMCPIILGGGHETAWGHYQGIAKFFGRKQAISIVNFDAHFDLREANRSTSGTPFKQIADHSEQFKYTVIGIQESTNTPSLFATAKALNVTHLLANAMNEADAIEEIITQTINTSEAIYLSVCLDVFSADIAPGVSAPQACGLYPKDVLAAVRRLAKSGKVVSFDIVELAPCYDVDNRTARLAALIIWEFIHNYVAITR